MNNYYKEPLLKTYKNRQIVLSSPMNQYCYFILLNKEGETIGVVYAKLIDDELAKNLIASNDMFQLLLPKNVWFEYRYDNIDKGIYVCVVELGE